MTWEEILKNEAKKDYLTSILDFLKNEYQNKNIYPSQKDLFRCFELCELNNLKVVILGQDPYHQPNQANGLAFSVYKGIKIPPSLVNIYKELNTDIGCSIPTHGELEKWAKQGVLLLNTCLSVEESKPLSHNNIGWNYFVTEVIEEINKIDRPIVFILWGNNSINYMKYLNNKNHCIICSVHPSPLSAYRGFFGSKPFSKTNKFLKENNVKPIDWQIEE